MRVTSPLSPGGLTLADGEKAWQVLLKRALLPWLDPLNPIRAKQAEEGDGGAKRWQSDWDFAVNVGGHHARCIAASSKGQHGGEKLIADRCF